MNLLKKLSKAVDKTAVLTGKYTVKGLASTIIITEEIVNVGTSFAHDVKAEMDSQKSTVKARDEEVAEILAETPAPETKVEQC